MAYLQTLLRRLRLGFDQRRRRARLVHPVAEHADLETAETKPPLGAEEADLGIQQTAPAGPDTNLVHVPADVQLAEQLRTFGGRLRERPRRQRLAAAQRGLGPVRLIEGGVVLRPGVRFQLQANRAAGELVQLRLTRLPGLGRRVPLEDDLPELARRRVQGRDADAEGQAIAVAVRCDGRGKPEPERRLGRQGQWKLDQRRAHLPLIPGRMHRDGLPCRRVRQTRLLQAEGTPMFRLRTRPADGHRLRRVLEDLHHGAAHRPAAEGQRPVVAEPQRLPSQRFDRARYGRQLGFQDQNRVRGARLPFPVEAGVGVDRVMGRVRSGARHDAKLVGRLAGRRHLKRNGGGRFAAPAIDHRQTQFPRERPLAGVLQHDLDRCRRIRRRHRFRTGNPHGDRPDAIHGRQIGPGDGWG